MKQIILVVSLMCFNLNLLASGWVGSSQIESYYVSGSGHLHIILQTGDIPTAAETCVSQKYVYYPQNATNFKEVFASVMAAKVSETSMDFFVSGCSGGASGDVYPRGYGFKSE